MQDRREHLMNLPIPKGGRRLDAGKDWVFVLKPLNLTVWTQAKKMARSVGTTEAALALIDTLSLSDCPKTKDIPENEVGLIEALEFEANSLFDAVEIDVKKN